MPVPRMVPNVEDNGPKQELYLCRFVPHYRWTVTGLVTLDLICPSTYQLLRSSYGDSGPDMSFDMSASPEYLSSLACASMAEVF
ncbi:hypothetical protein Tco_0960674 [Tanacetum coccineum]